MFFFGGGGTAAVAGGSIGRGRRCCVSLLLALPLGLEPPGVSSSTGGRPTVTFPRRERPLPACPQAPYTSSDRHTYFSTLTGWSARHQPLRCPLKRPSRQAMDLSSPVTRPRGPHTGFDSPALSAARASDPGCLDDLLPAPDVNPLGIHMLY